MDLPPIPPATISPKSLDTLIFVLGAAVFYTMAMIGMKLWPQFPPISMIILIGIAMVAAVCFEVLALRAERLGFIYVAILGAEVVLIALVSWIGFGERFTTQELLGVTLVLIGTAIAWY